MPSLWRRSFAEAGFEPWDLIQTMTSAMFWMEEYDVARLLLEQLIERARATAARAVLPVALDTLAAIDFRMGRWRRADGRSGEALRLARELGQPMQIASCLTTLAAIAACRGDAEACQAYAREVLEVDEGLDSQVRGHAQRSAASRSHKDERKTQSRSSNT